MGVFVTAWTIRIIAGKAAGSGNSLVSNLGKAVGGFFSLPASG